MITITLSSSGQFVLPSAIRKKLNANTGDQFIVTVNENTNEVTLAKVETIEEMSERFTSWIKPGTEPLTDTRTVYNTREPRL